MIEQTELLFTWVLFGKHHPILLAGYIISCKQYGAAHDDVIKWKQFLRYWPFVRWIPRTAQRPVTRSFDGFFDLRLNKRLSKQSWGWCFEPLPRPLWRHSNDDKFSKRRIGENDI